MFCVIISYLLVFDCAFSHSTEEGTNNIKDDKHKTPCNFCYILDTSICHDALVYGQHMFGSRGGKRRKILMIIAEIVRHNCSYFQMVQERASRIDLARGSWWQSPLLLVQTLLVLEGDRRAGNLKNGLGTDYQAAGRARKVASSWKEDRRAVIFWKEGIT